MAMSENSKKVFDYVKSVDGVKDVTATDIAEVTGIPVKSVNGIVTMAFQKKGLMERIPAEETLADGTHKPIKLIRLTDAGKVFDPNEAHEAAE